MDVKIENYIEIDGKDIPIEELSRKQLEEAAMLLSDKVMLPAGYKRKTA